MIAILCVCNLAIVCCRPLEEEVSKWMFIIEAMDKEGKSVSENLELTVQHHKARRNVNHEFTLQLHIDEKFDFPSSVDWQLKVLNDLTRLYGDPDTSQFVVRSVVEKSGAVNFTWTNDSLPRDICPKDEIDRLYKVGFKYYCHNTKATEGSPVV
jgi:Dystroglycan (Dystrophin-associated glycoprotein 1).